MKIKEALIRLFDVDESQLEDFKLVNKEVKDYLTVRKAILRRVYIKNNGTLAIDTTCKPFETAENVKTDIKMIRKYIK